MPIHNRTSPERLAQTVSGTPPSAAASAINVPEQTNTPSPPRKIPQRDMTPPPWIGAIPATASANTSTEKKLVVNGETTLLDLTTLAPVSIPPDPHLLIGKEIGENIEIHFVKTPTTQPSQQFMESCQTGKKGLATILENTLSQFDLKSTEGAAEMQIQHLLSGMSNTSNVVFMHTVAQQLSNLALRIHMEKSKEIGPSYSPREANRMPSACMMNLIYELEKAKKSATLSPEQKHLATDVQEQAKDRFMRRETATKETKDYFLTLKKKFSDAKLQDLSTLAAELEQELRPLLDETSLRQKLTEAPELSTGAPTPNAQGNADPGNISGPSKRRRVGSPDANQAAAPSKAELGKVYNASKNDNLFGRVWVSKLMAGIVKDTPQRVKNSMQQIGQLVWKALAELPADCHRELALGEILRTMCFWHVKSPKLMAFKEAVTADGVSDQAIKNALEKLFCDANENGFDCMATSFSLGAIPPKTKVAEALKAGGSEIAHWPQTTLQIYNEFIEPAKNLIAPPLFQGTRFNQFKSAGITLFHQPPAVPEPTMQPHKQWVDWYKPDIQNADNGLQTNLDKAVPYGTGPSGHTCMTMSLASILCKNHPEINTEDALLSSAMYITYDGGHSPDEGFFSANYVDCKLGNTLGLNLSAPDNDPAAFVPDYQKFFRLFDDGNGPNPLMEHVEKSWIETLDYYETNSYYESEEGKSVRKEKNSSNE